MIDATALVEELKGWAEKHKDTNYPVYKALNDVITLIQSRSTE